MNESALEPLLSSDETEALLHAMRGASVANDTAKDAELGQPDLRLRNALARADQVAREVAFDLRKILRRMINLSAPVREAAAEVLPFNVLSSSIAEGSAVGVLRTRDAALGLLVVGPRLTHSVLSRRLGGGLAELGAIDQARTLLSAVDRRILRAFLLEVTRAFAERWQVSAPELSLEEVLPSVVDLPRVPQFEPFLRIPLHVGLAVDRSDELSVVLSADAVSAHGLEPPAPTQDHVSSLDRVRLARRLAQAEVELVALLGHAQSTVGAVLSLQVGDVVRLEEAPDRPLQLAVEGRPKMFGNPVVRHGNVAIEVTEVLKGAP